MKIAKLFKPQSYLKQIKKLTIFSQKPSMPYNFIVDKMINPVSFDDLGKLKDVRVDTMEIIPTEYELWVNKYFPGYKKILGNIEHKKIVELYMTFKLLNIASEDVYLDAAGGQYTYINDVKCKQKIMHDLRFSEDFKASMDSDVELLECTAAQLILSAETVDKISCHHSFEHFQGNTDIEFIKEIQRVLKPGGRCCILPILIADNYVEITDDFTFDLKFDDNARQIIDPTATIPGKKGSGNFARVYDLNAFQSRILNNIDTEMFAVSISELKMNSDVLPDLSLKCHKNITVINRPYRLMIIQRVA